MADPQPIKQEIKVDYDGKGVEQAVSGLDKVEQNTESTAKATATYAAEADRLTRELTELATVEDRYQRAVEAGAEETEDSRRESEQRRQSIERLSREVAEAESHEDRLNRELRESVGAHRQAGDAADGSARQIRAFGTVTEKAKTAVAGFLVGLVGQQGLQIVFDQLEESTEAFNRRLEENIRLTREAAEARLNYVALKGIETPEDVAFIGQAATFAGRDQGEIARSLAQFKSQFPNASDADIKRLTAELASQGQVSSADLDDIAPGLAAIYRKTGDARIAGNLFQQGLTEAGEADPAKFADAVSKFLAISESIANLDTGQGVGFAAAATGLGVGTDESITGLSNVVYALLGQGTPEGREIREREKIDTEDFTVALSQVVAAIEAGRITGPELELLGGREAAPFFGALADPKIFESLIASATRVDQVEDIDGRLGQDKAEGITESSRVQDLHLLLKQIESQAKFDRSNDGRALTVASVRSELARQLEQQVSQEQIAPFESERVLKAFDTYISYGNDPRAALFKAARVSDGYNLPLGVNDVIPSFPPLFGADPSIRSEGRGLTDSVIDRIEQGPETDPQRLLDTIDAPASTPDAAEPLSAAGDTATHELLARLIGAVERLAFPGPGNSPAADPFGASAGASGGGGVTINGDVYTHGDPALDGLADAYRHA